MFLRIKSLINYSWENEKGEKYERWIWNIAFPDGTQRKYSTDDRGRGIYEYSTKRLVADNNTFCLKGYSKSGAYLKLRKIITYGGLML